MTNHMIDLKNTNVALIMGSNMAENHPIGMKWLLKGRFDPKRQTKIIHVDPRFTELLRLQIFIAYTFGHGHCVYRGMIKYIIDNGLYHKDYVVNYTNASFIIRDDFDFQDGLFSGYDPAKGAYDTTTWDYKYDENGNIMQDPTLQDPRVFQLLKKHYSRYDIDTVCSITGSPRKNMRKS